MKKLDLAKGAPQFLILLLAALLLTASPRTASAQDPPGKVARMDIVEGSVTVQPAGTQAWLNANPNRPLTTGDGIWVGDSSRGEMHIGGTAVRFRNDTGISFLNLNDQAVQIQLAQGGLNVRLQRLYPGEAFEIDTPNLAFTLLSAGDFTISYDGDTNMTFVIVRSGSGEVTGGGTAYTMQAAQRAAISGPTPLSLENGPLPPLDDFEHWCANLDMQEQQSMSARYISTEVIGYQDLDRYGTWRTDPAYGHVWVPSGVEAGWAPYHRGHWVNIAPWGWTWVDEQPWGFAPFHYGRWAYSGGAWVWVPGSVAVVVGRAPVRPMYAPALVAFVGGGGFSVSLSLGGGGAGVAWFPLGPRDVWVPSYHCSPRYVENVNISGSTVIQRTQITNVYNTTVVNNVHVTNITYSNQAAPGAVMAVSRESFVGGRSVAEASVKISAEEIQRPHVAESKPISASEAPKVSAAAIHSSSTPPASIANRAIVTKMKPAPQVVPIGHTETVAKSNLVKAAPPATPKLAPPPKAAAAGTKPGAMGNAKPAPPAKPAAPTATGKPVKPAPTATEKPAKPAPTATEKPVKPAPMATEKPVKPAPTATEKPVKPAPTATEKPAQAAPSETKRTAKAATTGTKKSTKKTDKPEQP